MKHIFRIPKVFEQSDLTLWQDPYLSQLLLKQHLNPHIENASRTHAFIESSAQWIISHIKDQSSILDLGCGPGLYANHFIDQNYAYTGVDFSTSSIEYAREHFKGTYFIQDYTELKMNQTFDNIVMIHCEYGSLSPENRVKLLKGVQNHLVDDGLFIFDVFTPKRMSSFKNKQTWHHHEKGSFFSPHDHIEISLDKIYDNNITLRQSIIIENSTERIYRQWYQYFDYHSIRNELEENGFEVISHYENLLGDTFHPDSDTLSLIVRKQK